MKLNWLWKEEARMNTAVAFQFYRETLEVVLVFKYLGMVLR